ncbi:hypothetical protein PENTCL1PPCAC_12092, partial [Pristionchus entomophagus]
RNLCHLQLFLLFVHPLLHLLILLFHFFLLLPRRQSTHQSQFFSSHVFFEVFHVLIELPREATDLGIEFVLVSDRLSSNPSLQCLFIDCYFPILAKSMMNLPKPCF